MSRRSGLGRGLAALIPPSAPEEADPAASPDDPTADEAATREDAEAPPTEVADGDADAGPDADAGAGLDTDAGAGPDADAGAGLDAAAGDASTPGAIGSTVAGVEGPEAAGGQHREAPRDHQITTEESEEPGNDPAQGVAVPTMPSPDSDAPGTDATVPATVVVPPEAVPAGPEAPPAPGYVPSTAATLAEVAPGSIVPNPRQPREVFDPEEITYLATSLADVGVLQPLVVRPLGEGRYELVAGERRLRAAVEAGLGTVPVVVRHTDDANLLKEALVENIHRVQLNPLEEGAAYQQLLEEFDVTQEELATRLGRSRPAISNAIRLLQLPPGVQRRVASGVLSAGHAKVLLAIDDPAQQLRLAERIVAEGMSVRATEELVRLRLLDEPTSSPEARRRPTMAPGLIELQDDLSDALEARVKISMGAKRGKLAIEFGSVDDLERIVSIIANGLEGARDIPPVPPAPTDGDRPDQE